jgi:hypothetical protein
VTAFVFDGLSSKEQASSLESGAHPCPIGGVPGISRPAVRVDVCGLISAEFLKSFARIVAFLAQALELPCPEQHGISPMWNHVVSNTGGHCLTLGEMQDAQGFGA